MKTLLLSSAAALSMICTAAFAEIELKIATDSGTNDAPSGLAIAKWAERIEEGSNGEIDVKVFYQDELGSQLEVFDLFVAGEVDLMLSWPSTSYDKRIGVVNTPFMVSSWEEASEAFGHNGWASEIMNEVFGGIGLKYLGAWPEGFAGVATRGTFSTNIEDANDIKVRVQPFFPIPNTMQALGYQTEALEWGEVFTSIQTGVVDGDSGNVIYWDYEFFGELLDYYVHTRHDFVTGNILANADTFDGMSDEHKQLILDTSAKMMDERFSGARAEDEANIARAVEGGMQYIEPSEEEVAAMKVAVRDAVWPLMEDQIGADIMDKIRAKAN
ncbi:TRAP transporter substrate-binding protein DctP [Epibacterium ulvae]|uniref:TRAP-type C4-dicarboxylate transport system, substrate-binding protein n=1 Tax=Epibacterium ulvae TaxID=1156985 RepID=A0A1G5QWH0_9RHOB|nr:TRAP transporter substrate-binding protein DctP [Epibacterium ulvae]SCZ65591.1 TRAP-type C4-dicarboxylate transport system, substrate-binding protein [Epibacterium ulvae]